MLAAVVLRPTTRVAPSRRCIRRTPEHCYSATATIARRRHHMAGGRGMRILPLPRAVRVAAARRRVALRSEARSSDPRSAAQAVRRGGHSQRLAGSPGVRLQARRCARRTCSPRPRLFLASCGARHRRRLPVSKCGVLCWALPVSQTATRLGGGRVLLIGPAAPISFSLVRVAGAVRARLVSSSQGWQPRPRGCMRRDGPLCRSPKCQAGRASRRTVQSRRRWLERVPAYWASARLLIST